MRKFAIAIVCFTIAGFILVSLARAEFTVDERSLLHFGVSAGLDVGCQGFIRFVGGGPTTNGQRKFCGSVAFGAGLFKEFVMDSHADAGDIFFNGLGVWSGDKGYVYLFPLEEGGGVQITIKY